MKLKIFLTIAFAILLLPVRAKAPYLTNKDLLKAPPRIIRTCCSFGADMGIAIIPFAKKTDITTVGELGPHKYLGDKGEKNGIIYTRRGGFLDLGHLRDCADWTAYVYQLILASKDNRELVITNLGNEGGNKTLVLRVPEDISSREACELAGKIAYDLSLWHEISTWFGASYVPLVPERFSAFSPEDIYSNLLGVHLSQKAIQSSMEYDEAMSFYLAEMLQTLECVNTLEETYEAMIKVDQIWYTSEKRLPNKKILLRRFYDQSSQLTPWIVPGDESCLPPYVLTKPPNNLSDLYQINIKLNYKFPVKEIFEEETDRIITQKDFDHLIDFIKKESIAWYPKNQTAYD